jgi:hypothetical protein
VTNTSDSSISGRIQLVLPALSVGRDRSQQHAVLHTRCRFSRQRKHVQRIRCKGSDCARSGAVRVRHSGRSPIRSRWNRSDRLGRRLDAACPSRIPGAKRAQL